MMKPATQKNLLKRRWYVQGINGVPAFLHAADVSGIKYMRQRLGFGYDNFIHVCRPDYVDVCYDLADLERLAKIILPRCLNDAGYFSKLLRFAGGDRKPLVDYVRRYRAGGRERFKKLSDGDLVKEYQKAADLFYAAFATSHAIEPVALTTDTKLRDAIQAVLAKRAQGGRFAEYFSALTRTTALSFAARYERDLRQLARKRKVGGRAIQNHINRYFWIQCDWRGSAEYDAKSVLVKLRVYRRARPKSEPLAMIPAQIRATKERLIKDLRLPSQVGKLIHLIDKMTKWQDDRKRDILLGVWLLDNMLAEVGRRYRLPLNELHYLLSEEMSAEALDRAGLRRELQARRRLSVYLFSKKEHTILIGGPARRFVKAFFRKDERRFDEIDGITASLGKARGRARICLTPAEAAKLKPGEILITTMTRPEFVPAMRKAAAVITDEGGLTSHAAIVARELGIPCIIGAKIATKIFKTGESVEVNADHGLVKRIK